MLDNSIIVAAKRTPIGSFQGILSPLSAPELGAKVFENIIQNFPMNNFYIDEVIMGNVLSAGLGQAPARQAAIFSGILAREKEAFCGALSVHGFDLVEVLTKNEWIGVVARRGN